MSNLSKYLLCASTVLSLDIAWCSSAYIPEGESPEAVIKQMTNDFNRSKPMKRSRSGEEIGESLEYGDKR